MQSANYRIYVGYFDGLLLEITAKNKNNPFEFSDQHNFDYNTHNLNPNVHSLSI